MPAHKQSQSFWSSGCQPSVNNRKYNWAYLRKYKFSSVNRKYTFVCFWSKEQTSMRIIYVIIAIFTTHERPLYQKLHVPALFIYGRGNFFENKHHNLLSCKVTKMAHPLLMSSFIVKHMIPVYLRANQDPFLNRTHIHTLKALVIAGHFAHC